jgi:SsrA-binding protein
MSKADNKKDDEGARQIAVNRRARFDYFIEDSVEAGIALQGWEVKALREGRANITEAYVILKNGEAFLLGAHITPLKQASTHVITDPVRTRKLLLHSRQLAELIGKVERAGYTVIPLDMHWTRGRAKLTIGLAKGKKKHDKRADIKQRDWDREKQRLMRHDR